MNRVISALHRVRFAEHGLADYGKPGNYFERQIGRWSKQYAASITQPIEEMDKLMAWLPAHIPPAAMDPAMVSIVHGDFRLDNNGYLVTDDGHNLGHVGERNLIQGGVVQDDGSVAVEGDFDHFHGTLGYIHDGYDGTDFYELVNERRNQRRDGDLDVHAPVLVKEPFVA
jgi:hypothetical protein